MLDKRMTPKAWTKYLSNDEQPVTLAEYQAGCISRILGCLIESMQATQHLEGMVGAMDDLLGRTNPDYASSGKQREALAAQREELAALKNGKAEH